MLSARLPHNIRHTQETAERGDRTISTSSHSIHYRQKPVGEGDRPPPLVELN
ncbi:MAG TPA: hypothetical protein V6C78_32310 [Crinalium sp.]